MAPKPSSSRPRRPRRAVTKNQDVLASAAVATAACGGAGADGVNVLWTYFLMGVTVCLSSSLYVMRYILSDRHMVMSIPYSIPYSRDQPPLPRAVPAAAVKKDDKDDGSAHVQDAPVVGNAHKSVQKNDLSPAGKEKLIKLLTDAGVPVDDEIIAKLPMWDEVASMYGAEPVFYGLDQCENFQHMGIASEHFVSTAGTFNTGTNLMAELLIRNCHMPERQKKYGKKNRGVRWQVLWGKHTPVGDEEFRRNHRVYNESGLIAENIFPAVTVRDPYKWMQSMCRHQYAAKWRHTKEHCPNLVPNEQDKEKFPGFKKKSAVNIKVKYKEFTKYHSSLAGFWTDWYNEYMNAPFPFLIVRFEDLVFHPVNVTQTACECAGGKLNKGKFLYVVDSAKRGANAHGKERTSYVDALIKYGTEAGRYDGFERADLDYARGNLDSNLMRTFGYRFAPQDEDVAKEEEELNAAMFS